MQWRIPSLVLILVAFLATDSRAQGVSLSFSHEAGRHQEAFDLTIDAPPGMTIRYTLDGSLPNDSSEVFSDAILVADEPYGSARLASIATARDYFHQDPPSEVRRATVVRAIGYGQDGAVSDVHTRTYFVGSAIPAGDLPVFSLIVDSTGFFGYDDGIYVPGRIYDERFDGSAWIGHRDANYMESGREWERDVLVQFFENGTLVHEQNAGARIHGGATRALRQKSLRLYARSAYGSDNSFQYPILGDPTNIGHRRILLRNGGQDFDRAHLRDPLVHRLVGHLNFETQAYRPAHVFLNGEYWGVHNVRERYDEHELSRRHGVSVDDVVILTGNAVLDTGIPGDEQHFLEMREYLLDNDVDESAMEMVHERLDIASFMDYHAAQIIVGNHDWPGNNIRFWRTRGGQSGSGPAGGFHRWRYIMFDMDDAFHGYPGDNTLALATEEGGTSWPNYDWSTIMLRRLLSNDDFRSEFIHRLSDLLNTALSPQHVQSVLDEMSAAIEPAMPAQLERWRRFDTIGMWRTQVSQIAGYASVRPTYVRTHMREFFELGDEHALTVDVPSEGGSVRVNRELIHEDTPGLADPTSPYPWTGSYFGDVPLRLTAVPDHGFRLSGWRIGADTLAAQPSIEIVLSDDTLVEALFAPISINAMRPDPHVLAHGPFVFDYWSADEAAGSFPYHMGFQQSSMDDPGLRDPMTGPYHVPEDEYAGADLETIGFPYNNTARTRINGLNAEGISFVNTGRGRDLGAAIVALDTRGVDAATVTFTGGTVLANSRVYHIRLQYRVGEEGVFHDVVVRGQPVEYRRQNMNDHSEVIGPVALPEEAMDQPYVQLRWKYYYTGERLNPNVGQRDELRLDDIRIEVGEPVFATRLAFDRNLIGAQRARPVPPFTIRALDDDGLVDTSIDGEISLTIDGHGVALPSMVMAKGVAVVDGLVLDLEPGVYRLSAVRSGLEVAEVDVRVVRVTEIVMPAYIQGTAPDNDDRVPFAFRIRIEGLEPGATYRFGNRVVDADDPPGQDGAGNMLMRTAAGTFARNTDTPRFRVTDVDRRHGRFTTSEDGSFEGWFVTEPSGNRRFASDNELWMLVLLNDGQGGEEAVFSLRTDTPVSVRSFSADQDGVTGMAVAANVTRGSVLAAVDHNGRVLNASIVEDLGIHLDDRYAAFYRRLVEGQPGVAGLVVPNNLPEGIAELLWHAWDSGTTITSRLSQDGSLKGHSTITLNGGAENPLYISFRADSPVPLLPLHNATEVDRAPTLSWEGADGPFVVEVTRRSDFVHTTFISTQLSQTSLMLPVLDADARYFWRVGRVDGDHVHWSTSQSFVTGFAVTVDDMPLPQKLAVHAPYPNPTHRDAVLPIDLPATDHVRVVIYDLLGRQLAIDQDGALAPGRHEIRVSTGVRPSGTYILRIEIGNLRETRTLTVAR